MALGKLKGAAGAALLGIALQLAASQAAFADTVYLTCKYPETPISRYLTIDYSANTVVTSDLNVATAVADSGGRTVQPAQITDSQIVWQYATTRAGGSAYAEHFTLNRLTGNLAYYDDGTRHSEDWVCQVGAKPTPKF